MNPRKKIEQAKKELTKNILSNIDWYKRAVIRKIEREYRLNYINSKEKDIIKFADKLQKNLSIPASTWLSINKDLKDNQQNIASLWNDYFYEVTKTDMSLTGNDYEKMVALYQVNFSDVNDEIVDKVIREVKRSVNGKYGFNAIRKRLVNSGLGMYTAENLTRTSLAQFDNAYHVELAQQAGAQYFIYDGMRSENTRSFCELHLNRVYTLAELTAMNNGQGLPVETSLGGYRCQHYLTALIDYVRKVKGEIYNPLHHKKVA